MKRILAGALGVIHYLENRVMERSFWGDIILAVSAAALLHEPWSYVFVGLSVVKALVPDGSVKPQGPANV